MNKERYEHDQAMEAVFGWVIILSLTGACTWIYGFYQLIKYFIG